MQAAAWWERAEDVEWIVGLKGSIQVRRQKVQENVGCINSCNFRVRGGLGGIHAGSGKVRGQKLKCIWRLWVNLSTGVRAYRGEHITQASVR